MSKPMLVTLPFLLLLLDYWPLKRFDAGVFQPLVQEKIPFFILSVASCAITFLAQKNGGAVVENISFPSRFINAAVSILEYLWKFIWPFDLSMVYPLPRSQPIALAVSAILLVSIFTTLALAQRHRRPWLLVGWLWFIGMLVPTLGLVQVGLQAMADRYTYLPILGLQLALLWTLREAALFWKTRRLALAVAVLVLTANGARTWNQIRFWRDSKTLYEHALAVTKENYLAESDLGTTLFNERD